MQFGDVRLHFVEGLREVVLASHLVENVWMRLVEVVDVPVV